MIPSRGFQGLRPAHIANCASKSSSFSRIGASRQLSSLRLKSTLPTAFNRSNSLRSTPWRAGAIAFPIQASTASSIRHASWWGKSSSEVDKAQQAGNTLNAQAQQPATVTTATPELAPAGIDKAAVVDSSPVAASSSDPSVQGLLDELLQDPTVLEKAAPSSALIEKVGQLKELGLDYGWGVTAFYEWMIEHIYIYGGFGWGSSIILSALAIRVAGFFLFQTRASDNMAKIAAVQPVTVGIFENMQTAMREGDDLKHQYYRKQQAQIYKRIGANPIAGLFPLGLQAAFGFGAFRCLRGMTELPVPGFENGGFLWFENLAVSDPYWILPVTTGIVMHLLMKKGGETGAMDQNRQNGPQVALTFIMPVVFTGITSVQPAALQMYFVISTFTGALSASLLRTPSIRESLKIAPLPTAESKAFWQKVATGEIPLQKLSEEMKKPANFAPKTIDVKATTVSRSGIIQHRGLNVREADIPKHLKETEQTKFEERLPTHDHDFHTGPEPGFVNKYNWYLRNYRYRYLKNRMKRFISMYTQKEVSDKVEERRRAIAKRKADEFEARRRERIRSRK